MSETELTLPSKDKQKKMKKKEKQRQLEELTLKGKPPAPTSIDHRTSLQTLTTFNTPSLNKYELLKVALRESMAHGSFINTKFYAFSRRRTTGIVDSPLPIYANSELLKVGAQYFSGSYFEGGFHEAKFQSLRGGFPTDKATYTECYDYDSDSDLEDEADVGDGREKNALGAADKGEQQSGVSGLGLEVKIHDAEPGFPLNTDIENHGYVVVVSDVAFRTWKALVNYIYTGDTNFARLRSQPEASTPPNIMLSAPPCSPKSMYRLADKCGLDNLKQLARADIRRKLTETNMVDELCSSLTSMCAEVRDMEIEFACSSAARSVVLGRIPSWLHSVADGSLGHTVDTLAALVLKLSEQPPPLPPSPVTSGSDRRARQGHPMQSLAQYWAEY